MSSITARACQLQEGANNSPITTFRYALRATPDTNSRMDRDQLQQLCLEQLYILTVILAIIRNPLAAISTRIVAVDLFLMAIENNIKRKVASITERSRIYISGDYGVAKRLGIHANTVSKSFKNLETYKMIKRDYTLDTEREREYLDITLTDLPTQPQRLQDKTLRKMAEAGKKPKQKTPDGNGSALPLQLSCPSCGEDENLQVTCRTCGTTGNLEEFAEGPQGDDAVIVRAEVQAALIARLTTQPAAPQAAPPEPRVIESTLTPLAEQNMQAEGYNTNFVQYSNNAPQVSTQVNSPGAVIAAWLEKRIGRERGARIIWATGAPTSEKKYMAKPADYQPDIRRYIKGEREHIYGSYLGRPDGSTWVLSFDFDTNEAGLDARHEDLLRQLAQAGAAPIYWQRANNRGHFELYFSEPVNANRAREWVISVCPALAAVEEVYPARDKQNSPISWPLWQRKGDTVFPCTGKACFAGSSQVITFSPMERRELARGVEAAVTPASLIPPAPEPEPPAQKPGAPGALDFEQPAAGDIARLVIEEFNRRITWEELIERCGGANANGKFAAVWRGERTPSCKVDADGRAACDYGRIGNWPKKFDKYQLWCWLEGIDKRVDLARRCQAYRDRQQPDGQPDVQPAAPRELDLSEVIDQAAPPVDGQEISDDPEIQAILEVSASRETEYTPQRPCTKCGCTFTYNLAGSRLCCLCYPFRGMSDLGLYERMKVYSVKVNRF